MVETGTQAVGAIAQYVFERLLQKLADGVAKLRRSSIEDIVREAVNRHSGGDVNINTTVNVKFVTDDVYAMLGETSFVKLEGSTVTLARDKSSPSMTDEIRKTLARVEIDRFLDIVNARRAQSGVEKQR